MPRNIVICFDGTNNEFGSHNTNVVRMVQVLDRDPQKQLVYYDAGVGTLPEPGFVTPIGKWISKVFGLAFGAGLAGKITGAYTFLMDHYQPGDRIYLYGFSRGAYTARALAGVLYQFGLLAAGNYNLIPYVLRLQKSINDLKDGTEHAYWKVTRDFRATFARINFEDGQATRFVRIHFLGVWDTVSSVGWVWDPIHYPYATRNPSVDMVRHAVALDEHRAFFIPTRWPNPGNGKQDVREIWFAGVHSDVGGGYPEADGENRGGLWRTPFLWMVRESVQAGLLIRPKAVRDILKRTAIQRPAWANRQHESLNWKWWLAEFMPKWRWDWVRKKTLPYVNRFRRRVVPEDAELHRSLLRRLRRAACAYEPTNLSPAFRAQVQQLTRLPPTLPYRSKAE